MPLAREPGAKVPIQAVGILFHHLIKFTPHRPEAHTKYRVYSTVIVGLVLTWLTRQAGFEDPDEQAE
ncbi:unnamed protein product [Protopolystoma xenopodis]|uniref:Uncharacterized protein n=1 Tax=Protopolystoma xenopodis TaxID=117903 RepID=A0A3S5FC95_9PLAT|nr:unnamed protein product [Protopolystoma xenopodis]